MHSQNHVELELAMNTLYAQGSYIAKPIAPVLPQQELPDMIAERHGLLFSVRYTWHGSDRS